MATIKTQEYANIEDIKKDLDKFLIYYNFDRSHGSLRKELKIRTQVEAVIYWFKIKSEIFRILPDVFQDVVLRIEYNVVKLYRLEVNIKGIENHSYLKKILIKN